MVFKENFVKIKIDENSYVYANSISGAIDFVDGDSDYIVSQLIDGSLSIEDISNDFKKTLEERGYLINEEESLLKKNKLFETIRAQHEKRCMTTRFLSFVITYDCNFRCPYCYQLQAEKYGVENIKKAIMM